MAKQKALVPPQESEERFHKLMDCAPVMIWTAGRDNLANYFNKPWLQFTGRPLEEEVGNGWTSRVHPEDLPRCLGAHWSAFTAHKECRVEYRHRRFDNQYRWISDQAIPRFNEAGEFAGYMGFCIDVTDRKNSEEAVMELSGQLINAQEAERARLARELHDNVGQRVAMLSIDAELIKQGLPSSQKELRQRLEKLCGLTADLSRDIRRLSHQLHSAMLDHVGLLAAVRDLCKQVGQQHGMVITVDDRNVPETIPHNISLCLFRVLQESLNNLVKHSGALEARVSLEATHSVLRLKVSDKGVGFDPDSKKSGLGLISIKERLRLVGGKAYLRSSPNSGTEVTAEVPLFSPCWSVQPNPQPEIGAAYAQGTSAVGR